ncbi:hypothetical protein NDU88_003945 [Pleurodeles waltl]|uniref:Uncharacterized protein n=1 Tax=Pleurodeles waltl TaxID=8319 RepID=A0AAV7MTP9_PLEWA|nr:hypothetical protein NDU88_003945 [Pleurodeles waltl]
MRPADLRWACGPDEVDCRGLRGGERPGESWGRAPKVVPCRGGAGGPPPSCRGGGRGVERELDCGKIWTASRAVEGNTLRQVDTLGSGSCLVDFRPWSERPERSRARSRRHGPTMEAQSPYGGETWVWVSDGSPPTDGESEKGS